MQPRTKELDGARAYWILLDDASPPAGREVRSVAELDVAAEVGGARARRRRVARRGP
ncbi:MAG TPA: hypothetical protein VHN14_27910 [Kofleriaceae bacterium]|nr:hypothetical protein [Kofleriaceae bacterium]